MVQEPKKYQRGRLYDLDISELLLDGGPRGSSFDAQALRELATSIRKHGVRQPVLVRTLEEGGFVVVSGERRYQASLEAGLTTIPALVTDGDPAEIFIVENLLRENFTAVQEAEAIERLRAAHNYQLKDLAGILGKAESTVCEILSLNKLPDDVKDECRNNPRASRALLIKIARERGKEQMRALYQKYKDALAGERGAPAWPSWPAREETDFTFLERCRKRIDALDVGGLDGARVQEVMEELRRLRAAAFKKLKLMRVRGGR